MVPFIPPPPPSVFVHHSLPHVASVGNATMPSIFSWQSLMFGLVITLIYGLIFLMAVIVARLMMGNEIWDETYGRLYKRKEE